MCALAIVALAGWLQMVTVGESPSHTESYGSGSLEEQDARVTEVPGCRFDSCLPYIPTRSGPQEPSHIDLKGFFQPPATLERKLPFPLIEPVATVAAASVGQLTEEQAIDVLRAAGAPQEWIPDMLVIGWCESHYRPGAVGDSGNSLGWFQLWSGWFYAGEDPFDALTNARVAVRVRETRGRFGGAGGWSCAGLNGIQ